MRLTRRLIASFFAISLVAVGTAGVASAHDGGMTPQQMKCMASQYKKDHAKLCKAADKTGGNGKVTLAHPLTYKKNGIIDVKKIDLTGVAGVTKQQAKVAKQLLVSTATTITKWNDPAVATADGFQSIGDGVTGEEHFLHWDWINDSTIFDPNHPESLVYHVDRATGKKQLEAAMYILPDKYTLTNPPKKYTSNLVQYHEHDNLCFNSATATQGPQVRGLTRADGTCGTMFGQQLTKFNPNIQVHVWIRPNECGPFASLLGVGAGQIKSGTQRSCVHMKNRLGL